MKLLFVCMGNICRSPTAEGVMAGLLRSRGLHEEVEVDSAGTGDWHVGQRPDPRAVAAAGDRGVTLSSLARQVSTADLDAFDLVLAADRINQRALFKLAGDDPARRGKIHLLREFDPASVQASDLDVPDPYYGEGDGFEHVLDICEAACQGLLVELATSGQLSTPAGS
jgi:protein-tyrosine phosphatase